MKQTIKRAIGLLMTIVLCLTSIHIPAYAQEVIVDMMETETTVQQKSSETVQEIDEVVDIADTESVRSENEDDQQKESNVIGEWDGTTKKKVFEGNEFKVTYKLQDSWNGGYNAIVKIENTGDITIENWTLGFDYQGGIASVWNAVLETSEPANYVVKNAGWNQDIAAGQSVEFGINGQGDFAGFPSTYQMLGQLSELKSDDYSINYKLTSDWGSGFNANITITNNTDKELEDWILEFDFDRNITDIWNATIDSHEGNHYVVKNAEYNANILPEKSVSFGFTGSLGTSEDIITNVNVYSYGYQVNASSEVDCTDTDGDGLPDFYEDMIKTDKNNCDSDGDGLPDGYEMFKSLTYPNEADTDGNGILDGDEDSDFDGISTIREYERGIDPMSKDTDKDGLYDHAELMFGMNPNKQSTLDDGIYDGNRVFDSEIALEESNNGVKAYLQMNLSAEAANTLTAEKITNDQFLDSEIPGYICDGYDLHLEYAFDSALLTFELPESIINESEDPAIFYWNEATQLFEEVSEQYIEGNKIIAKLVHFSKYICLDKDKYNRSAFKYEIDAPIKEDFAKKNFDVAFVLDDSGSVSTSDFNRMKNECITLSDKLAADDRMSLFMFGSRVYKLTSFGDKNTFVNALNKYKRTEGMTALYSGISSATTEFTNYSVDASRIMIVVTDGYDNQSSISSTDAINKAISEKVIIYCIGVGNVNSAVLQNISESTGGSYYHINQFAQLNNIFETIITEADLYKDSDGDGISDYHEKKIALGELQLGSGKRLNKSSILDYLNADSDDDGLLDGEEIDIKKLASGNYYLYMYSNPCLADTDGDGIDDYGEDYIGFSPLFPETKAIQKSMSNAGFQLPTNLDCSTWTGTTPWEEWKALVFNDFKAWNFIHIAVQNDIKNKYLLYGLNLEEPIMKPDGKKRKYSIDIFRSQTNGIWEVKPSSYATLPKLALAKAQIKNYVNEKPGKYGGEEGTLLKGSTITVGDYSIVYSDPVEGLIFYQFKRNKPVPAYQPQEEKVEEDNKKPVIIENYVYQADDYLGTVEKWGLIIVAITVVGSTVVEDVLTAGAGTADDIPSIMLAIELLGKAGFAFCY